MLHIKYNFIFFLFIVNHLIYGQNNHFIKIKDNKFYLAEKIFYSLGTNAYFLHSLSCKDDTSSIKEFFEYAKSLNMNTIRIWAFSEGERKNIFTLHYGPYNYNEESFIKLDYVLYTGSKYNIKFILTLCNNWDDFGGIKQYLNWFASRENKSVIEEQRINVIRSQINENNIFDYNKFDNISHDDFFLKDTIKNWYKAYVKYLLNRKNFYTGLEYKNDNSIMAFELINEPESSDKTGKIIYKWLSEMSKFFKSIDTNHLLTTGETGFDVNNFGYGKYPEWLLDGSKGISFKLNSSVKYIDYTTAHLYSDVWNNLSGSEWIYDHKIISDNYNKPFLLSEFGSKQNRRLYFSSWLTTIKKIRAGGALLWQMVPQSFAYDDGYSLKVGINSEELNLIRYYFSMIQQEDKEDLLASVENSIYPNPSSSEIYLNINMESNSEVEYEVYDLLGRICLNEKRVMNRGNNVVLVNVRNYSSGVYFLKIMYEREVIIKKFVVIK